MSERRPVAELLAELLASVARLERKLDAALCPPPRLLSKRAAAKMLGVGRGDTLEAWIRSGALRLVGGKIPLADLDRLVIEGPPARTARPRRGRRQSLPANDVADEIRKINV